MFFWIETEYFNSVCCEIVENKFLQLLISDDRYNI